MDNTTSNGNLIVIEKAIEATALAISLVRSVPAPLKSLAGTRALPFPPNRTIPEQSNF